MNNPYQTPTPISMRQAVGERIPFVGETTWSTRRPTQLRNILAYFFVSFWAVIGILVANDVAGTLLIWRVVTLVVAVATVFYSLYQIVRVWRYIPDSGDGLYSRSQGFLDDTSLYLDSGELKQQISLTSLEEARRFVGVPFATLFFYYWDDTVLGRHAFHVDDFRNLQDYQRFRKRLNNSATSSRLQDTYFPPREIVLPLPETKKWNWSKYPAPLLLPDYPLQIVGEGQLERADFNSETIQKARANRRHKVLSWHFFWTVVGLLLFASSSLFICIATIVPLLSLTI